MIFVTRYVSALPTARINLLKIEHLAIPEHYWKWQGKPQPVLERAKV
jgi:hypothetical protein